MAKAIEDPICPAWFKDSPVRIYDVAIRPAQAKKQPKLLWRQAEPVDSHPALTSKELNWLTTHRMELGAFRPEQIIKRLFRAMHHLPEIADRKSAEGGGGVDSGSGSDSGSGGVYVWNTEATTSDGGGDSFG